MRRLLCLIFMLLNAHFHVVYVEFVVSSKHSQEEYICFEDNEFLESSEH